MGKAPSRKVSGGDFEEATPDPFPNSEVKLFGADGTARVAVWESRTLPGFIPEKPRSRDLGFFLPFCSDLGRSLPAMRLTRRGRIVLAVVGLLLAVACVSVGPLVRRRAAAEAERRGITLAIGAVRPGFFAVRLLGVDASPEGVAGVEVHLDEVQIDLSAALSPLRVHAVGDRKSVV